MAKRTGGFIGQDGINAPDPATGVEASGGDTQATVSFTSPSDVGGADVTEYRVTDSTGAFGATGSASPITVSGLTNGTSYTFNVWAINPFGWSSPSDASGSVSPAAALGIFAGGYDGSGTINVIDTVTISTTGNATDFGDMLVSAEFSATGANSTRAIVAGGYGNDISYLTFASAGNSTDFGDLLGTQDTFAGCSDATRTVFAGGNLSGTVGNTISYITTATTGNAADFGDLSVTGMYGNASCSSPTRGLFAGGFDAAFSAKQNVIEYVTIASTGNAADFGDLLTGNFVLSGCSNATRGIFAGGRPVSTVINTIQFVTIASTGNATDFGDLTDGRQSSAAASSSERALWAGGDQNSGYINSIEYVAIASTANATDFGDLTVARSGVSGTSSAHGGLQ